MWNLQKFINKLLKPSYMKPIDLFGFLNGPLFYPCMILENIGSLSYKDLPNFDICYDTSKNHVIKISPPVSAQ